MLRLFLRVVEPVRSLLLVVGLTSFVTIWVASVYYAGHAPTTPHPEYGAVYPLAIQHDTVYLTRFQHYFANGWLFFIAWICISVVIVSEIAKRWPSKVWRGPIPGEATAERTSTGWTRTYRQMEFLFLLLWNLVIFAMLVFWFYLAPPNGRTNVPLIASVIGMSIFLAQFLACTYFTLTRSHGSEQDSGAYEFRRHHTVLYLKSWEARLFDKRLSWLAYACFVVSFVTTLVTWIQGP